MKRSEALKYIEKILIHKLGIRYPHHVWSEDAAEKMLSSIEELGMAPPLSNSKLVPDPTRKGTMMHTESKREWDNE